MLPFRQVERPVGTINTFEFRQIERSGGKWQVTRRLRLDPAARRPQGSLAARQGARRLEYRNLVDALGQRQESCVMLGEVSVRFPSSAASIEAQAARAQMGCV